MTYVFICSTEKCENHKNPVYLEDPINPVLCSLCGVFTDATPEVTND